MRARIAAIIARHRRESAFAVLAVGQLLLLIAAFAAFLAFPDWITKVDAGLTGVFFGLVMGSILGWMKQRLYPSTGHRPAAMVLTVRRNGTVYESHTTFSRKDGTDFPDIVSILRTQADVMDKIYRERISKAN